MKKILLILFFLSSVYYSQELDADVIVNVEQLTTVARENLMEFERAVEDYLNNTKFTENTWEYDRIKTTWNIFFVRAAGQTQFTAQAVITSQRKIYASQKNSLMMNIMDNSWEFEYEKNQSFNFDLINFENLTGFLDYYAYVIIGLDMDSYGPEPYQGSQWFNRALEIALRGANSTFSDGWQAKSSTYNKRGLVEDLLNTRYQPFRQDFMNYHFNGLDIYKEYPVEAKQNIAMLINHLYENKDKINPRSVLMKVFFDAKAGEIVAYLQDYKNREEIFEKLKVIDPGNISKYDKGLTQN